MTDELGLWKALDSTTHDSVEQCLVVAPVGFLFIYKYLCAHTRVKFLFIEESLSARVLLTKPRSILEEHPASYII